MTNRALQDGVIAGITNTRLSTVKRGIAVALGRRIQRAVGVPVCILGADPTDRDIERWMPDLLMDSGRITRREVRVGPHEVRAAVLVDQGLSIVTLTDRTVLEKVLPQLRATFSFVIIDGPSSVGRGVGIAPTLWPMLDILLVASGLRAGDLAMTTAYVDALMRRPSARDVDIRVITSGDWRDSGLGKVQVERKLRALPVIASLPQLVERSSVRNVLTDELDRVLDPVVGWIIEHQSPVVPAASPAPARTNGHGRKDARVLRYLRS